MVNNAFLRHTIKQHGAARQQKISDRQIKNLGTQTRRQGNPTATLLFGIDLG